MDGTQSPAQRRAQTLRRVLELQISRHRKKLGSVGGNFLLHIPGVAAWTVMTQGPRPGIVDHAGEDEIQFAMSCDDTVLGAILTDKGGNDLDLEQLIADGRLKLEGDVGVLARFLELGD